MLLITGMNSRVPNANEATLLAKEMGFVTEAEDFKASVATSVTFLQLKAVWRLHNP